MFLLRCHVAPHSHDNSFSVHIGRQTSPPTEILAESSKISEGGIKFKTLSIIMTLLLIVFKRDKFFPYEQQLKNHPTSGVLPEDEI